MTNTESEQQDATNATKASTLRGIAEVLNRDGTMAQVLPLVPPHVRAMLRDPPASSAWIASADVDPIFEAVHSLGGPAACRRLLHDATLIAQIPMMMTFVRGLLRVFGGTPHTLFSRVPESIKLTTRGVDVQYTRLGERSCRLRLEHVARNDVPLPTFHAVAGGMEVTFKLCGVTGRVSDPVIVPSARGAAAEYVIEWA